MILELSHLLIFYEINIAIKHHVADYTKLLPHTYFLYIKFPLLHEHLKLISFTNCLSSKWNIGIIALPCCQYKMI